MPIKKRLSETERVRKQLPDGWRHAINHPLMRKQCYGHTGFDASPKNIVTAINMVKGWRGATFQQKLFVITLDLIMEKAYGEGLLDPDNYNRLQEHLDNNQDKMKAENHNVWQTWCWDFYHDHYGLQKYNAGALILEELPKPKKKIVKKIKKSALKRIKKIK